MAGYYDHNISVSIDDDSDVIFRLNFISNSLGGMTDIDVPGPNEKYFKDNDAVVLGKAKDLRTGSLFCTTKLISKDPNAENIKVEFLVNDKVILKHISTIVESRNPRINIYLKVEKP